METLIYKFVEAIPDEVEEGILYVSMEYSVAIHLCVCGCRNEVVTPLSPTDWKLIFNGIAISLRPSIGNWNFKCRSHYFITENKIEYASQWSGRKISEGRKNDKKSKKKYFESLIESVESEKSDLVEYKQPSLWRKIIRFLGFKSKSLKGGISK